jgi:tripartite-type tricarboxylate transporter receptor subunit TctC
MPAPLRRRTALGSLLAVAGGAPLPRPLRAQGAAEPAWPSRPVRLIVPYPPGGGSDIVARVLVPALMEQPGAPQIVIDNRPGAGGNIGTEQLAKSPPDGYTLGMLTIGTHGTNPWLFPRLFDPLADFTPVALVSQQPIAVAVAAGSPLRSMEDLLALRREGTIGSSGNGTSGHLGIEVLRLQGRLPLTHVPYRGSGPLWADLLGGRVDLAMDNIHIALPHHQAGRVRILALSGRERMAALPGIPVLRERLPEYLVTSWNGIGGPAGLPPAVTARLAALVAGAARTEALRGRYAELGMELPDSTPERFAAFIREQLEFWRRIITAANIRAE